MFQIVFKSGFSWDWVSSIIGVVIGFLLTAFRDIWKEYKTTQKERKEFLEIKALMPDIITLVKAGLKDSPRAIRLTKYLRAGSEIKDGKHVMRDDIELRFGRKTTGFSEDSWNNYCDNITYLRHAELITTNDAYNDIVFSRKFLTQIKKWG